MLPRRFGGRRLARVVRWVFLAVCLLWLVSPQAWDAERMLAAARATGPRALDGAQALQRVLQSAAGRDDAARLAAVNDFFNLRVAFRGDIDTWGAVDHWASPLQLLERGMGDCEDYAIAKYFSLQAAGVPASRLRLVYVREQAHAQAPVQPHMVLAYYAGPQADPLVLDNLVPDIRPASRRPDLTPVFSFNAEGLWNGTAGPSVGDATARLSAWRQVIARARDEGFQ
jgi:predicted transglutaminase-like cysteine proteinase